MEEIAETMSEDGGFGRELFNGVSEVYRIVAEETELGAERTGEREKGLSGEDVARWMVEGMGRKKVKTE